MCKEIILHIPLEIPTQPGEKTPTLLPTIMDILVSACQKESTPTIVPVGLLRLLCTWLDDCTQAVKAFMSNPTNIPFLVEKIIQPTGNVHVQGLCALLFGLCLYFQEEQTPTDLTRTSLYGLIVHRMGLDKYIDKLDRLRKSNPFIFAEQERAILPSELTDENDKQEYRYYDYEFTVFFKDAYDVIVRGIRNPAGRSQKPKASASRGANIPASSSQPLVPPAQEKTSSPTLTNPQTVSQSNTINDSIVNSYKELIRTQDKELESLKKSLEEANASIASLKASAVKSLSTGNDEIALLKHQVANLTHQLEEKEKTLSTKKEEEKQDDTESTLFSLSQAYNELEALLGVKEKEIAALKVQVDTLKSSKDLGKTPELQRELDALRSANNTLQITVTTLQAEKAQRDMQERIKIDALQKEIQLLKLQPQPHPRVEAQDSAALKEAQAKVGMLEQQLKEEKRKCQSVEHEQDELLVQLAKLELTRNNLQEKVSLLEAQLDAPAP